MPRTDNPFNHNTKGWSYHAWDEGYTSAKDETNPYLPDNEALGDFWQNGREQAILDGF